MAGFSTRESRHISLCEVLDRVLTKGVVISGDIIISVADIELIRLRLQAVLASAATLLKDSDDIMAISSAAVEHRDEDFNG